MKGIWDIRPIPTIRATVHILLVIYVLHAFYCTGPPSIPLNLRLNSCDGTAQTLTLTWDKPASNGGSEIVQYGLTVEPAVPQCSGICYVDANTTQFQFGPLNTSTHFTFTVHADNCNATQQGDQSNITVFYGGE